jgi:hypothetical protein
VRVVERCFYCETKSGPFHEDHVVPFSRGGSSLPRNLVLACASCNTAKSDRLPSEWRQDLQDRVYKLEDQLVTWHQQVDERRRYAQQGIVKGCWLLIGRVILRVDVVDARGVRGTALIRELELDRVTIPDWKRRQQEKQHLRLSPKEPLRSECAHVDQVRGVFALECFSRWFAWSELKRLSVVEGGEQNECIRILVEARGPYLESEIDRITREM